jgi:hypothetical protein
LITALAARTEEIRRFHAAPWPFQQTFLTPHKDLSRFTSILLAQFSLESAALSTDEVVFEPECLLELMARHSIQVGNYWNLNLSVEGQESIAELLEAALGDPVDFIFLPSSESIVIYADHDGYTTFYCKDQSILKTVAVELVQEGFEPINDYIRGRSGDKLR